VRPLHQRPPPWAPRQWQAGMPHAVLRSSCDYGTRATGTRENEGESPPAHQTDRPDPTRESTAGPPARRTVADGDGSGFVRGGPPLGRAPTGTDASRHVAPESGSHSRPADAATASPRWWPRRSARAPRPRVLGRPPPTDAETPELSSIGRKSFLVYICGMVA
jgi:hypothetical protein